MPRLPRDAYAAVFLILLSTALLYTTFYIESPPLAVVGSEVWPRVILLPLIVLALSLLVRSLKTESPGEAPGRASVSSWFAHYRRPIVVLFLYLLFLLGVPYLGMLISGLLFTFCAMLYLGDRTLAGVALYAAVTLVAVGGMWVAFIYWLGVILPRGAWTGF